jgi:hypothetical protein
MTTAVVLGFLGQWIWTGADAAVYRETHADEPQLAPAVFVATFSWNAGAGALERRLANVPTIAGEGAEIVLVVRFDDSVHAAWSSPDAVVREAGAFLADLVARSERLGVTVAEVQLDYDCPVRRLPEWSAAVRALRGGSLAGRKLWITSLPAHVADPRFGALFAGAADGHVLQLFDTGLAPSEDATTRLLEDVRAAKLPFRIGLGAFERGARTDHAGWFANLARFAREPAYAGAFVFPAGHDWLPLFPGDLP